jgi:hypothetical protein
VSPFSCKRREQCAPRPTPAWPGSVMCRFEMLRAGAEGPRRHRPENWLMRQLTDEPKPVYEVGFIGEKGKATVGEMQ